MLRMIFVVAIILVGTFYAAQGPFYALLFYLWNAYFRPEEWVWNDWLRTLNLSFVIGVYLVIRTALSAPGTKLNWRTGLLWMFFLQALMSSALSAYSERSFAYLNLFGKVLLISYLIVLLVDTREKLRLTLVVISASLGFEAAKQGWANLILYPGAQNNNPIPFLGDNNGVALGTMMLVPILLALAQSSSRRWERYGERFLGAGVFLRGFSTYSRGGFLAASVLGLLILLRSERKLRTLAAIGLMTALVASIMPPAFWNRMQTITFEQEELDASALGRLHFWRVARAMAADSPVTGVGLNAFPVAYGRYNVAAAFEGERAVHSIWFGVLAELGYPGLMLFVAIWGGSILSNWRIYRQTRGDPSRRDLHLYGGALMTSLIIYGVAGSFLSHHYNEMAWHFFGLSTALHLVATAEAIEPANEAARAAIRPGHPAMAR